MKKLKIIFILVLVFASDLFASQVLVISTSPINLRILKIVKDGREFFTHTRDGIVLHRVYNPTPWTSLYDYLLNSRIIKNTKKNADGNHFLYIGKIKGALDTDSLIKEIKARKLALVHFDDLFIPYSPKAPRKKNEHIVLKSLLRSGDRKILSNETLRSSFIKSNNYAEQVRIIETEYQKRLEYFLGDLNAFLSVVRRKLPETPILIVPAHGEPLFEHGNFHPANDLYQESLRTVIQMIAFDTKHDILKADHLYSLQEIANFINNFTLDLKYPNLKYSQDYILARNCEGSQMASITPGFKFIQDRRTGRISAYDLNKDPKELSPSESHQDIIKWKELFFMTEINDIGPDKKIRSCFWE